MTFACAAAMMYEIVRHDLLLIFVPRYGIIDVLFRVPQCYLFRSHTFLAHPRISRNLNCFTSNSYDCNISEKMFSPKYKFHVLEQKMLIREHS